MEPRKGTKEQVQNVQENVLNKILEKEQLVSHAIAKAQYEGYLTSQMTYEVHSCDLFRLKSLLSNIYMRHEKRSTSCVEWTKRIHEEENWTKIPVPHGQELRSVPK